MEPKYGSAGCNRQSYLLYSLTKRITGLNLGLLSAFVFGIILY